MSELIEKLERVQQALMPFDWNLTEEAISQPGSPTCCTHLVFEDFYKAQLARQALSEYIQQITALEAERDQLQLELTQRTDDRYKAAWLARWAMDVHLKTCAYQTIDGRGCQEYMALREYSAECDKAVL